MNRRRFLSTSAAAAATVALSRPLRAAASAKRPPRILLRSSWQSVNIGDVGHTPGALNILEKHFPEAELMLWPGTLGHGSRDLLTKAFPRLRIVEGSVGAEGEPTTPALAQAWAEADLYLSGSGSGFPAANHAVAFQNATGKPVGVFGVSADPISGFGTGRDPEGGTLKNLRERALKLPPGTLAGDQRTIMDRAAFFFCRDSITRDYLKAQGVKCPIVEFGPDAQLGMSLRDDARGLAYLRAQGLEEGKFTAFVPRVRYTPYHRMTPPRKAAPDDAAKDAINDRTTERDLAKLRDLIVAYVRATGHRAFVCPEMTYQIELARDSVIAPLPADVKKNVVWRDTYWMPDEAASIYARALAVVSIECHSPLIALHVGTPTFYLRQPTDTCKGQMSRDVGADDWFFEIDETDGAQLWSRLAAIHRDPAAARAKVKSIMAGVEKHQRRMVDAVKAAVGRG
ncbi:MAG: hypothetical protein RLZZ15_1707 [Verrucomicrobiota bacterium]